MSPRHRAPGRRRATETTDGVEPVFPASSELAGPSSARGPVPEGPHRPDERQRRFSRGRTIRARLALILSVPTVLLVVLAGLGVANQFQVAGDANAAAGNVDLVLATQDLIHSFQQERGLTSGLLGGATHYRAQVDAQRRASNQNRVTLDRLLARTDSPSAQAVRGALARLNTLGSVRASVDSGQLDRSSMLDFYTTAIVALSTASDDVNVGQHDLVLRRGLEALHALGDAKEAIALERGQLNGVFAQGRFNQDDYVRFTETRATKLDALAKFDRAATPQRATALQHAQRTPEAVFAAAYERRALAGASGKRLNLSPPRWSAAMATVGYDLRAIQRDIGDDTRARAQTIKSDADLLLALYAGAAAATLVIALLLWLYTFRSIVRPLRALTFEAHEAAERRLPSAVARIQAAEEPGDVVLDSSRSMLARREDEFAEVAGALDHLQQTAVRLAVEQAVMRHNTAESLANLGRRNQNLVRRQLGFISALEREEADPNALANLFELDHLATRMRRNAESLLVLVGERSPRRWSGAVDVGDVLRSAFAEVEDYRRVILRRADNALVQGAAAAEISHLLAELVENALSFSPPDQEVEVQARSTGTQYHIAIVDQGVGMSPEAMATSNARLRGEQSFLVTPTRDLGHYVVGRLAQRLGIEVWLHDSPLNGVTARVVLPGSLLVPPEQPAAPTGNAVPAQVSGGTRRMRTQTGPVAGPITEPIPSGTAVAVVPPPGPRRDTRMATARDGGGMETTRNGLVKRQPRENTLRRPERAPAPPPPPVKEEGPPRDVRSMLNAFRSGIQSGEHKGTGEPQ
jgi:signal transduction histidine kinase